MSAWACRLENYWARLLFVSICWFWELPQFIIGAVYHRRLTKFEFYNNCWCVYWAAVEGAFVGEPKVLENA